MAKGAGQQYAEKEDLEPQLETDSSAILANIRALRSALSSCRARVRELEAEKAAAAQRGEIWQADIATPLPSPSGKRFSALHSSGKRWSIERQGRRPSITEFVHMEENESSYIGSYGKLVQFLQVSRETGDLDPDEATELLSAVEDISRFSSGKRISWEQALFKDTKSDELNQILPSMGIQIPSDKCNGWGTLKSERPPPKMVKGEDDETNAATLIDLGFNCRKRGDHAVDASLVRFGFESPFNLLDRYAINSNLLLAWVTTIAGQYNDANAYHNWMHALDVFHFCYSMLVPGKAGDFLTSLDILALLTATIGHDVGHIGFNNAFLINTKHELAIRYNDSSPLENMHASTCFQVLQKPATNFLDSLSEADYKAFRSKVIDSIMATDMAHHFELVDRFSARVSSSPETNPFAAGPESSANKQDQLMLMQAITHMADLGHCCRRWEIHKHMVVALEQEFFVQGDQERKRGMPVMPMMDREKDSAAASQNFFLSKMVFPLLESFTVLLESEIADHLKENLADNKQRWDALIASHGKQTSFKLIQLEDPEGSAEEERRTKEKLENARKRSQPAEKFGLKTSARSQLTPPSRALRAFEY